MFSPPYINNVRDDNRLCNLQLLTPSENNKKSAKNRDKNKTKKCVKATNCSTKEVSYYDSISCCSRYFDRNPGTVVYICNGQKYRESSMSKKDGQKYKFEYIEKENLPGNHHKITRRRVSDEHKKEKKNNDQNQKMAEKRVRVSKV